MRLTENSTVIRLRRQLLYLGPLLAWMGVIALLSTDVGSREHTMQWAVWLLRCVLPSGQQDRMQAQLEYPVTAARKFAHVFEYAVLAFLACRWLWFSFGQERRTWQRQGVMFSSGYAILDELHQGWTVTRTAAVGDVAIDLLGAALGLVLFARAVCRPRKRTSRRA